MKTFSTFLLVVLVLSALVYGAYSLVIWPRECADRNGAYIIPQQGWPVCVVGR